MSENHGDLEHDETTEHVHAVTAFMVLVDELGRATAVAQPPAGVIVDRLPDVLAIRRACRDIVDDLNAQIAGQYAANDAVTQWRNLEFQKAEAAKPSEGVKKAFKKRGK